MTSRSTHQITFFLVFLISITACAPIFENNYDVMARQAIFDLMKAQENYHAKHNKYSKQLAKLLDHGLKYHTGIVYLEIHSAGQDEYRAISLPAESSTARVFAYDTNKGGFYEADEVEVSKYVLGALNFIRSEKKKQNRNIFFTTTLLGSLAILGFRFVTSYQGTKNNSALASYFVSLFPLGWAVAILNHLNSDIVFSLKIKMISLTAISLSFASILITSRWIKNRRLQKSTPAPILGLAGCTLFISIINVAAIVYIVYKYYPA